jgi:hypothetical protein
MRAYAKIYREKVRREDYRSAQICWLHAEMNRDKKKRPKQYQIEDFLLDPPEKKEPTKKSLEDKMNTFVMFMEQVRAYGN